MNNISAAADTFALTAQNLRKSFGGNLAVAGVDLAVPQSKITAIIGPNGSGKSTLFNLLTHTLPRDSGSINIAGKTLSTESDAALAKQLISRTFQVTRAFTYLTLREHLALAFHEDDEQLWRNFWRGTETERTAKFTAALSHVGLDKTLTALGGELSYGQTKLLMLAVALSKPHQLLLLDEPVAGVNPKLRVQLGKLLRSLRAAGETILLIEHDMNFVLSLADYVVVLNLGEVIATGTPEEILANPEVLEVYLGK